MSRYQYPRVNPPSSQQQQPHVHTPAQNGAGVAEQDNRPYSWVHAASEPEDGRFRSTQSNIPPLPQIPDHLNPALQPQRQPVETQLPEPAPEYPGDQKNEMEEYNMQPVQHQRYPEPTAAEAQPPYHRSTPSNTAPEVIKHEYQSAQEPSYSVVPDVNPLTPTESSYPQSRTNTTTTTNIPMIPSTAVPTTPPAHLSTPRHAPTGGPWRHALCSCADTPTCLTSLFCPCITYGKTQHRLTLRAERADPTNMLGYRAFNGACAAFAVLCGCNFILAAIQHTRVRKAYGVPGGVGDDCVHALCCCCCTLAQDEKEVKWRELEARGSGEGSLRRAGTVQYQSPAGGMSYPGPPR